jgi:DNA-binding transcriptional LysR family regulator
MDLNSLIIFDKVAEFESFTAAAKALKMPKSNVSLKIHQLEEDLGLCLFERSTRKVRITDYGQKIRALTQTLIEGVKEISSLAEDAVVDPKGVVRVSAPYDIGYYLLRDVIPKFLKIHADVSIDLDLSNRFVDLIHEGFDLAIRASGRALEDSSLVATKLSSSKFGLYAAAKSKESKIKTVAQLEAVDLISFNGSDIILKNGKQQIEFKATSRVKVHDMQSVKNAVFGHLGLGFLPVLLCAKECDEGSLVHVLPEWYGGEASFHAVYSSKRLLPLKTRVFLEFLQGSFVQI